MGTEDFDEIEERGGIRTVRLSLTFHVQRKCSSVLPCHREERLRSNVYLCTVTFLRWLLGPLRAFCLTSQGQLNRSRVP